jgi:hypothetical protein
MQLRQFRILFASFSLLAIAACKSGPKVAVYVSDPASSGMQGVLADGKPTFKPYIETENYVCYEPNDMRTLLEYCSKRIK